jgi:hypothetical protein
MPKYTMFLLRDGQPVRRLELDCAEDLNALAAAGDHSRDHAVEVWQGGRLVGRVRQGPESS